MTKYKESIMKGIFFAAACTSILAVALICLFLFINGVPAMAKIGLFDFLLGRTWKPSDTPPAYGIFPMILGSIYVTAGAAVIGVPIGILTAVFMARYCPERLYRILKPAINLLAGIPSVVYGFFGLVVIVPLIRDTFGGTGSSMLTASILLGIMILPTIIRTSEEAIRTVPTQYREVGFSLGATKWQSITKTVLPSALPGIANGIILSIGRCVAETAAVILTAGSALRMPTSLFSPTRTMAVHFYILAREGISMENAFGTAALLIILIFLINIVTNMLINRFVAKGR
jgi:phosphate transport system permease protein